MESASGSLGGITASRNRGGPYFRGRAVPTNPNSTYQQAVRSIFAQMAANWSSVLDPDQRAAWDLYAENVPLPDPLGDPRNVGGLGMYQRCNVGRLQAAEAGLVRRDTAPTIFDLGEFTAPIIGEIDAAADTVSIAHDDADVWADETGSAMLIWASRPQNPGINFFKGPYRYCGLIEGVDAAPPPGPTVLDLPFPCVTGQRLFFFARVTRLDGRMSASFRGTGLAVAGA
jgi:hypothetical protein